VKLFSKSECKKLGNVISIYDSYFPELHKEAENHPIRRYICATIGHDWHQGALTGGGHHMCNRCDCWLEMPNK